MKHLAYQRGATLIEFALGLLIFLMFLLGIVDFSRMLFTWAAANEATRAGARYAVVCADPGFPQLSQSGVLAQMKPFLPQLTSSDVVIDWDSKTCTAANCLGVSVSVKNLNFQWIAPIVGSAAQKLIPMPKFATYLPREILRQDPNSGPACDSF